MRIGRYFGRGHFTSANRPNRLVGDDNLRKLFGCEVGDSPYALRFENLIRLRGLAFVKSFPDAVDRDQAALERSNNLLVRGFFSFTEVLAALAVSDDYPLAAHSLQHTSRDLPCVSAFFCPEKILSTGLDLGAATGICGRR